MPVQSESNTQGRAVSGGHTWRYLWGGIRVERRFNKPLINCFYRQSRGCWTRQSRKADVAYLQEKEDAAD